MYRGSNKLNDLFLGAIGNNTAVSDSPIESVTNPAIASGSDVNSTPTADTQDQVITKEVITTTEGVRSDGKPAYDVVLQKPNEPAISDETKIILAPASQSSTSLDEARKKRVRNTLIVIAVLAIAYYFYTQKNK